MRSHYSDNMVQVHEGTEDSGREMLSQQEYASACYSYQSSRVTCHTPTVHVKKPHSQSALLGVGFSL